VTDKNPGRVVNLDEHIAGSLQELSHRDVPVLWGPLSAPFHSADGKAGFKRALRKEASTLYARMGLAPRKPLHFLRATALTNMRRRGVPAWIIRQVMGHTTDRIGDEHYNGVKGPEAAHKAAELMSWVPAAVAGGLPSVTQA
jgi:integrase